MVQFTLPLTTKSVFAQNKAEWHARAKALENAQDWPALLAHCRLWTNSQPGNDAAWFGLGVAYFRMGNFQESLKANREGLRIRPDVPDIWNNIGCAYGGLGRYQEAIKAFKEALRIKPNDAMSWGGLALAYADAGNRSAALEAVKELRRYDPQKADELFNRIIKP